MKLEHVLAHTSGPILDDCCYMGYRFDPKVGFVWDQVDSWVFKRDKGIDRPLISQAGWLTDLWQSPSHTIFVSGAGLVHRLVPQAAAPGWSRKTDALQGALAGIWGLDDRLVFTWGELGKRTVMFLWEGDSWREIPSPGYVNGVHGVSRDLIYAVGQGGLIARWNGTGWDRVPSPTANVLSRVFVASPDVIYAAGAGCLLEGSVHGWSLVATALGHLYDVAVHRDKVWVAAGPEGLLLLDGKNLSLFSNKIAPESFDARHQLLISTKVKVLQATETRTYKSFGMDGFTAGTQDSPPLWATSSP